MALQEQGKLEEAVASWQQALRLKPDDAEAHNNLGIVLQEQGKLEEAAASLQQALRLKPDYAEAHNNLGIVLKEQGKLEEAAASLQQAVRLKPDVCRGAQQPGNCPQGTGQAGGSGGQLAAGSPPQAGRMPRRTTTWGLSLQEQGKLGEAIASWQQAIRLKPDYAEAHNNLGNALREQGKLEEAAASLQQAIRLKPDYAEAHNNLGGCPPGTG